MKKKEIAKKKCLCGRKVMVVTNDHGGVSGMPTPECGTCKTYGLEESKRLFVQEDAMIRQKSTKTIFTITKGTKHVNDWKKKKSAW